MVKHPILTNPAKYIAGFTKHSSALYQGGFYNAESLSSNPLANALMETRAELLKIRYPKGEMVQLYVDTSDGNSTLTPLMKEFPQDTVLITSHYITNNANFFQIIDTLKEWRRYMPMKFRYRNSREVVSKVKIPPNMTQIVQSNYVNAIQKQLKERKSASSKDDGLIISAKGDLFKFEEQTPSINLKRLIPDLELRKTRLSYTKDKQLCSQIIKLLQFLS